MILISSRSNNRSIHKLSSKMITFYNHITTGKDFDLVTPYSISRFDLRILEEFKPDIVHIHNWYNLLNYKDLGQLFQKFRVVLTVHDERFLTGGCHVSLGCTNYLQECRNCPQVIGAKIAVHKSKQRIDELFANSRSIAIISPSNWLMSKFVNSKITHDKKNMHVIPNPYELSLVESAIELREKNQDGIFELLFTAADSSSPNKALDRALEAVRLFAKTHSGVNVRLRVIGSRRKSIIRISGNLELRYEGRISQLQVAELMRASNLLLVTSKSENFPNVVVEAMMLHLPVLATAVGGIPELVKDKITGILAENSVEGIVTGLRKFHALSQQEIYAMQRRAFAETSRITNPNVIRNRVKDAYLTLLKIGTP